MSDTNRNTPESSASAEGASDTISLLDLIAVIAKRKRLIFWFTAIVAIVTVGFLLSTKYLPTDSRWNYLPDKYKPVVKILLQDTSASSSLSSVLNQSGLGSLSGLIGLSGTGRSSNADLAQALLKSNGILDAVSDKFRLVEKYKITKYPRSATRHIIQGSLKVKYDAKSGILEIGYEDIDRVFATEVLNDIASRLQESFRTLTLNKIITKKAYLDTAIASAEEESRVKAKQLMDFQNKYGIYDLTSQSAANIEAVADLQADLRVKQINLAIQKKYYPESDTRIIRLKDEIEQIQKQIEQMNSGDGINVSGSVPLSTMTQLGSQYLILQSDVKVQQAILSTLKQQHEMARLEEMDTSQSFQVIENAEVPEVRSGPSRSKTAIIVVLSGFFSAVLLAFIAEYLERANNDPVESQKLSSIRSSLSFRKKQSRE